MLPYITLLLTTLSLIASSQGEWIKNVEIHFEPKYYEGGSGLTSFDGDVCTSNPTKGCDIYFDFSPFLEFDTITRQYDPESFTNFKTITYNNKGIQDGAFRINFAVTKSANVFINGNHPKPRRYFTGELKGLFPGYALMNVFVRGRNSKGDELLIDKLSGVFWGKVGDDSFEILKGKVRSKTGEHPNTLYIRYKIKCQDGFFGPKCSKTCLTTKRQTCDLNGQPICRRHYFGIGCSIYCFPYPRRFYCDSNGKKICEPGYVGSECSETS